MKGYIIPEVTVLFSESADVFTASVLKMENDLPALWESCEKL